MAEICRGVEGTTATCKPPPSLEARRRRMELRRVKFVAGDPSPAEPEALPKRQRLSPPPCGSESPPRRDLDLERGDREREGVKYGMASVCGRRRDMEDAVAIHTSFCPELHYFGVYDGHGCSHVATRCRERLHELVKEEVENKEEAWKSAMERSFSRMDKEVVAWNRTGTANGSATCRCELRMPDSDAVGSTAVTAVVTPNKIIVANCGDSRAVLCRGGKAIPLSTDHKPDRPDELSRIESAGGRVIYWDGPRVLGVLAMSRAIGDNYLKPFVSSEPEVTETNRSAEDDCLILASDGLWDVVTNETACRVARMCLKGNAASTSSESCVTEEREADGGGERNTDKACSDASMLLTKLALARRSTDNVSVVVIDLRRDT